MNRLSVTPERCKSPTSNAAGERHNWFCQRALLEVDAPAGSSLNVDRPSASSHHFTSDPSVHMGSRWCAG